MKKTAVLFEERGVLGRRLAEYINRLDDVPVKVQLFTEREKLLAYAGRKAADLLICDEEEREFAGRVCAKGYLYLSARSRDSGEEGVVCKYQSAQQLLQLILKALSCTGDEQQGKIRSGTSVYAVFSGENAREAELFSLLLGQAAAARKSVLCLTLDPLPGLEKTVLKDKPSSLSDALYYDEQGKLEENLVSLTGSWHNVNVLGGLACPEDLAGLSSGHLAGVLGTMAESGLYDCLIINCGTSLSAGLTVFPYCRKVFVAEQPGLLPSFRQEYFREWFKGWAAPEAVELAGFCLPAANMDTAPDLWLEAQLWGTAGNLAREIAVSEGVI